ncbi:hypothetical protein [Methylomagnum ishizawai]|uniref:hypothetical protein n=1 Tax=Methylomagnum ishizawai TaxID=1760988 RepID=UPI001C32D27D|nr:hypothetical protein [Methylomagnum ishizawai]BBL75983.1 hypothetical protein MishRS11D_30810 [Methylomagnum ishizawai]
MTTTVSIEAHHPPDKEVSVSITENGQTVEAFALRDGESAQRHVYDGREISVKEVAKPVGQIHDPA